MTADTPFVEYLNVLWRKKLWMVVPLILGLIVGEVLMRNLPKMYSAQAAVIQTPDLQVDRRYIEAIVSPSIQPFALTSCEGGSNSVRMPYLAGEYAAAPNPTTA